MMPSRETPPADLFPGLLSSCSPSGIGNGVAYGYGEGMPDPDPLSLKNAAVLVPVFRDPAGELRLVMIRRVPGGIHSGQMAFPGGRPEPRDEGSMLETALRETEEEIGLPRARIEILEALPAVETITTGIRIFPFLARIRHPGGWRKEPSEVDEVLEIAVSHLLRPGVLRLGNEQAPNWDAPRQIAFYRVGEDRLWGASFRIVRPLLKRFSAREWKIM